MVEKLYAQMKSACTGACVHLGKWNTDYTGKQSLLSDAILYNVLMLNLF